MYIYVKHSEIDKEKWDALLSKIPYAHFYALYSYLTSICDWDAIIEEKNGVYETIIPLPFKKKFGVKYLYQPFFCQQLGVFSLHVNPEVKTLFKLIKRQFTFGEFQWHNSLKDCSLPSVECPNYTLALDKPYTALVSGYNKNRKRLLKKAKTLGLEMSFSQSPIAIFQTIDDFRSILGQKFNEVTIQHYKNLRIGLESINELTKIQTGVLKSDGKIVSTILTIEYNNRINYLLGYTDDSFKKQGIQGLLFDALVEENCENNKILDFEGSKITGIAQFYKSFGAKKEIYLKFILRSFIYKMLKIIR